MLDVVAVCADGKAVNVKRAAKAIAGKASSDTTASSSSALMEMAASELGGLQAFIGVVTQAGFKHTFTVRVRRACCTCH